MMVKHIFGRFGRSVIVALIVGATLLSVSIWRSAAVRKQNNGVIFENGKFDLSKVGTPEERARHREHFIASIREGISAIRLPSADSSGQDIRVGVDSLAGFIQTRTGIRLPETTRTHLATLEAATRKTGKGGISIDKLSKVLTKWVLDRVSTLTDREVDAVEDSLRGFTTPELAANPPPKLAELGQRKNLHLRGSVMVHESMAAGLLKSIRDRAAAGDETLKQEAYRLVRDELGKRVTTLSEAVPGVLGEPSPDVADVRLTPLQSFLLVYSVLSDDPLTNDQVNLEKAMRARWEWAVSRGGGGYFPPPDGHYAYGANGYLYSSPLDLFFSEKALGRLMASLDRRRTL